MDDQVLVDAARDAVMKGSPWQGLLALALFLVVLGLRYGLGRIAEGPARWRRAARWLATTHVGGIVTSLLMSSIGAALTALAVKGATWIAVWNAFATSLMAGGLATIAKAPRKQREDRERSAAPLGALLVVGALGFALSLPACAPPIVVAARTVESAAKLGQVAGDMLVQADDAKQDAINAEGERTGDKAGTKAKLAAWRLERAKARGALKAYSLAVSSAASAIVIAQAKADGKLSIDKIVSEVMAAVKALRETLAAFDIKVPALSSLSDETLRTGLRIALIDDTPNVITATFGDLCDFPHVFTPAAYAQRCAGVR